MPSPVPPGAPRRADSLLLRAPGRRGPVTVGELALSNLLTDTLGALEEWVRSITEQVTIDAPPHDVHAFVASPERLPVWAIGFAKAIRLTDDGWRVTLAAGNEMPVRIDADAAVGTVDFVLEPTPGVEVVAPTRVLANGDGAEYVFTMFQAPDMPDEVFEQQAAELRRELTVLKAHLETACPR